MSVIETDIEWMRIALEQANKASAAGEVPVGAIVVNDNELLATGYNQPITTHDPTAHAEIIAMRDAGSRLGNYRLTGTTLYVTLEPCPMCVGAMIHARVKRVVFGATDPKTGAAGSVFRLAQAGEHNHVMEIQQGVLAEECSQMLRAFFKARRGRAASQVTVDRSGVTNPKG